MKFALVIVVAAFLTIGCSGKPFDFVSASGKVTYDDGSLIPAERIVVTFVPETDSGAGVNHPPNGVAEVDPADGTFAEVTSHQFGDGLLPGQHKVQIVALDQANNPTRAVPAHFANARQTPLIVDTADAPFHLKVPKP